MNSQSKFFTQVQCLLGRFKIPVPVSKILSIWYSQYPVLSFNLARKGLAKKVANPMIELAFINNDRISINEKKLSSY